MVQQHTIPLAELSPPRLVREPGELRLLLADLERAAEVAVDTEADSFFNYREKVCLIQITALEQDWLVDPLAGLDLAPLGAMLADPRKTKVFHDGEYDVLILKRDFGFCFSTLFDTRVAAAALGHKAPGLGAVIKEHFGVELDKSQQRSNWSQRPLSPQQIAYARLDTRFLIPLMHLQRPLLDARGRQRVVSGECSRLEQLDAQVKSPDPDAWARLKGARNLRGLELSVLRELFAARERLAQQRDLPPFKVLSNDALLALASQLPRDPRAASRPGVLSPRQLKGLSSVLEHAFESARAAGPLERFPNLPPRDGSGGFSEEEFELHERLKQWRKQQAEREDFDSSLVLNRHALTAIAKQRPRELAALERIGALQPWQIEQYGAALLQLVASFESALAAGEIELGPKRRVRRDPASD